jgi:hypothetical protein
MMFSRSTQTRKDKPINRSDLLLLAGSKVWKVSGWVWLLLVIGFNLFWISRKNINTDFHSFLAAGRAAAAGLNPYDPGYPLVFHLSLPQLGLEVDALNLNPPISLLFFEPLAYANPQTALWFWRIVLFSLYALTIFLIYRTFPEFNDSKRLIWAFSLAGLWQVLEMGQVYIVFFFICAIIWSLMGTKQSLAIGVLIGIIVAFKPNFAVWPVLLIIAGYWGIGLTAIVTAGLISVIPVLRYGPGIYAEWIKASSAFNGITIPGNSSFIGLSAYLGLPWFGVILSGLFLISLVVWVRFQRPSVKKISSFGIVASLLASPITWGGYTLLLLPIMLERKWSLALKLAAIMLTLPFLLIFFLAGYSQVHQLVFGWWYGWTIMLVLVSLLPESEFAFNLFWKHWYRRFSSIR